MFTHTQLAGMRRAALAAGLLALACTAGCKARENGVAFSNTQATAVDQSWVVVVKSCWPDLAHSQISDEGLKHNLADPIHFRSAFGTYAQYSDDAIIAMVAHPVSAAPSPDDTSVRHARTPVLSRSDALRGSKPLSSPDGSVPDDALCALQSGNPIGFK